MHTMHNADCVAGGVPMAKVMFGSFNGYSDWQSQIMQVCHSFHAKYNCYPKFIRMREKTLQALLAQEEQSSVLSKHDQTIIRHYLESIFDYGDEDDFLPYPVSFGPNDDGTVSFETNKYELYFLEGEDLFDDYFVVQNDGDPDDGEETPVTDATISLLFGSDVA